MKCLTAALVSLLVLIPGQLAVRILQHPQTKRVPEGGSVTFECSGEGEMGWYVDETFVWGTYRSQLQNDGFTFSSSHYPSYSDLRMRVPAKVSRNGTEIKCEAYSSSEVVFSNISWLWIMGPPLSPNVSLELTSWDTLTLYWDLPFTHDGFPIEKYIVFTTNSSSEGRTETLVYPTADASNESLIITDTPSLCHTLTFEVVARSSAGTSSAFTVSGGFPIAVTSFHMDVSVILTVPELIPQATISFKPPEVCAGDTGALAVYSIELRTELGRLVSRVGGQYHESELMEETLSLASCSSYSLSVTVSLPSFPQLGSHTNTTMLTVPFGCPLPSTKTHEITSTPSSTPTTGENTVPPKGVDGALTVVLGAVVGGLLLLVGAGVCGVVAVFILRRRRITVERQKLHRLLPPMSPNPIYESSTVPLYDVIPDNLACKLQGQVTGGTEMSISNDDNTRYAMTPSKTAAAQLLEREDSGISGSLSKRVGEDEEERRSGSSGSGAGGETEKEDCYISMQSCG